jgi:hypothetical protein
MGTPLKSTLLDAHSPPTMSWVSYCSPYAYQSFILRERTELSGCARELSQNRTAIYKEIPSPEARMGGVRCGWPSHSGRNHFSWGHTVRRLRF